jgi:hypothetical protein
MFKYPIGIQLFNRPQYARRVLESIHKQSQSIDEKLLTIYIDGFEDSIYEKRNAADFTGEVESIAREIFPNSEIRRFLKNYGIADLHNRLQSAVFAKTDEWAVFFEEDVVLDSSYLMELEELIEISEGFHSIVKLGCFQIIDSLSNLPRGFNGFYPGTGTKAFAERKIFYNLKQEVVTKFLDISRITNDDCNNSVRCATLAGEGYFLPYFQKDSLIENFMHFQNKFHVVTKPNLATDIGFEGIHNYTTAPLVVNQVDLSINFSVAERKGQLEQSFDQIKAESKEHVVQNYKDVLQGYHTSKSRKAMLRRIFQLTFRKKRSAIP